MSTARGRASAGEESSGPSSDALATADLLASIARGAVAIVWIDFLAYLGQLGAVSGYERGRRELLLGWALAATAASFAIGLRSRAARDRAPQSTSATGRDRSRAALELAIAAACMLVPVFFLTRTGLALLRPSGVAWIDAFLVALLPASALAWIATRTRTSFTAFAFGASAAYLLAEALVLPRLGWVATLCAFVLVWLNFEARAGAAARPRLAPSSRTPLARTACAHGLFAAVWGALACAAMACARPIVFEHVSATRAGASALVAAVSIGIFAGAWLGLAARRTFRSRMLALVAAVVTAAALWTCARNLQLYSGEAELASLAEDAHAPIAWRALIQGWFYFGFPAVALGALFASFDPRGFGTAACVIAGACAGAWIGETVLLPRWLDARDGEHSLLLELAHHPINVSVETAAWNPDGIAARFQTIAGVEPADLVHWHAQRWERDPSWKRLEEAELRLPLRARATSELWVVGHPGPAHRAVLNDATLPRTHVLDPLPDPTDVHTTRGTNPCAIVRAAKAAGACVVMLSDPRAPASFSLCGTTTFVRALEDDLSARSGSLWIWCDPRALTPTGVERVLASWASEFPSARLYVLQDGYAGPLFGLDLGGAVIELDDATVELVVVAGRADECIARSDASSSANTSSTSSPTRSATPRTATDERSPPLALSAPTLNRPALEWEASNAISPFPLPDADVLAAIASRLATPKSELAGELFRVLELHARAQVDRPSFQTKWDRVRIDASEIDAALALLERRPGFDPSARAVANIAGVLYEKRDYDVLFDLLTRAIALRPDVARLHHLLGRVRRELLDQNGAIAEYELARALDPGSVAIKSELAKIYAEQSRWNLAVPLLEEAWSATSPPDPVIAKALGLGYLELHRTSDARRMLEFAWHESPGDFEIKSALERMDAEKH